MQISISFFTRVTGGGLTGTTGTGLAVITDPGGSWGAGRFHLPFMACRIIIVRCRRVISEFPMDILRLIGRIGKDGGTGTHTSIDMRNGSSVKIVGVITKNGSGIRINGVTTMKTDIITGTGATDNTISQWIIGQAFRLARIVRP
jgi:hypothetical protein